MAKKTRSFGDLDEIDVKIVSALAQDGRLTGAALAEKVGLSVSPCWARVRRLEESGVIERYAAVLDHQKLGYSNTVFVEITLDKHDDKLLDRFDAALARMPEVIEAHLVSGDHDYLIKVMVQDAAHYETFLREKLYRIGGVRHTRSTFGLRTLKRLVSLDVARL